MFDNACHMCEEFGVFLLWIRVSRSDIRECVFTHQTERKRDESKEICV